MSQIIKPFGEIDSTINKKAIEEMGKAHAAEIIQSQAADLKKVYIEARRYEMYLNTLLDELKDETVKQITLEAEKNFEFGPTTVSITKRRKFDFSADKRWNELATKAKETADQRKSHEAILKDLKEGDVKEIANEETGEMMMIHGPKVAFTESLMVKIQ